MESIVQCPFCDGMANLKVESRQISYKQEHHTIKAYFYQCEKCLEEFTTTETDTHTIEQLNVLSRES